jgi:hypothetical protein
MNRTGHGKDSAHRRSTNRQLFFKGVLKTNSAFGTEKFYDLAVEDGAFSEVGHGGRFSLLTNTTHTVLSNHETRRKNLFGASVSYAMHRLLYF